MLALVAILLKLAGVAFLIIAAVGVLRFRDPFQRMHAATKAGTLGAGFVLMGAILSLGTVDAAVIGSLAIMFLLLTVPVAGHLLGRAAYVSGADMSGLRGPDALDGILSRRQPLLDDNLSFRIPPASAGYRLPQPNRSPAEKRQAKDSLAPLSGIRFAVVHGQVEPVANRAIAIAETAGIRASAHAVIDTAAIEAALEPTAARAAIRARAAVALGDLNELTKGRGHIVDLHYEEGNPEHLIPLPDETGALLLLPNDGWFHHGAHFRMPLTTWEPDGLLRLSGRHGGPVIFAGTRSMPQGSQSVVVRDDGAAQLPDLVAWALRSRLWSSPHVHLVWPGSDERRQLFEDIAEHLGVPFRTHVVPGLKKGECDIPAELHDSDTLILSTVPRPLRANWYGYHWFNRISRDWCGEILVFELNADQGDDLRSV